jgi:hypothetical protein
MSEHAGEEREDRYERWLSDIAQHLRGSGVAVALGYDDRPVNNMMYLGVYCPEGYTELMLMRGGRGSATAVVLSENRDAAGAAARELAGAHRDVLRRHNAKRKFLHMIERIATRLAGEFADRARDYPEGALKRLGRVVTDAQPMTGIVAHRHIKKRRRSGDEVRYGASIAVHQDDQGMPVAEPLKRALRYDQDRQLFKAYGNALHSLRNDYGGELAAIVAPGAADGALMLMDSAVAAETKESGDKSSWTLSDVCDCSDCGLDLVSCMPSDFDCSDIGGCDTPDCGGCDIPDCSF